MQAPVVPGLWTKEASIADSGHDVPMTCGDATQPPFQVCIWLTLTHCFAASS